MFESTTDVVIASLLYVLIDGVVVGERMRIWGSVYGEEVVVGAGEVTIFSRHVQHSSVSAS